MKRSFVVLSQDLGDWTRPKKFEKRVEPVEAAQASQQEIMPKLVARRPDRRTNFVVGNGTTCPEVRRRAAKAHSQIR